MSFDPPRIPALGTPPRRPVEDSTASASLSAEEMDTSTEETYTDGDNWASPSEVRQLQSTTQQIIQRYQTEMKALRARLLEREVELEKQQSRLRLAEETRLRCEEGLAQNKALKQKYESWQEEKELSKLQMHKLMIENQRLQMLLEKEKKKPTPLLLSRHPLSTVVASSTSRSAVHHPSSEPRAPRPAADDLSPMCSTDFNSPPMQENSKKDMDPTTVGNESASRHLQNETLPMPDSAEKTRRESAEREGGTEEKKKDPKGEESSTKKRASSPFMNTRVPSATAEGGAVIQKKSSSSSLPTPSPDVSWGSPDATRRRTEEGEDVSPSPSKDRDSLLTPSSSNSQPTYAQGAGHSSSSNYQTSSSSVSFPHRHPFVSLRQTVHGHRQHDTRNGRNPNENSPNDGEGRENSSSTWSATLSSGSSIPYLYQLPRTPAEALQGEVKLLQALKQLTQEKLQLENRIKVLTHLSDKGEAERDMRLVSASQEISKWRRLGQHWQERAETAESHVQLLREQLLDAKSAFDVLQVELDQTRERVRSAQEEAHYIANTNHNEIIQRHREELNKIKEDKTEAESLLQSSLQYVQQELETTTAAYEEQLTQLTQEKNKLEESHHTLQHQLQSLQGDLEQQRREQFLEKNHYYDQLARQKEIVEKLCNDRNVLQEQVQHLLVKAALYVEPPPHPYGDTTTAALEERYNDTLVSLEASQQRRAELEAQLTAAEAALKEAEEYFGNEVKVHRECILRLQEEHRRKEEKDRKAYERLQMKYESAKLKIQTLLKKDRYDYSDIHQELKKSKTTKPKDNILNESGENSNTSQNAENAAPQENVNNNNEKVKENSGNESSNSNPSDALTALRSSHDTLLQLMQSIQK